MSIISRPAQIPPSPNARAQAEHQQVHTTREGTCPGISARPGQPGPPPRQQQSGNDRTTGKCHGVSARLDQRRLTPQIRRAGMCRGVEIHDSGAVRTQTRPKHPDATQAPRRDPSIQTRRGYGSHEGSRVAPAKDNNTRRVCHSAAGTCHQDQPLECRTTPTSGAGDPPRSGCDKTLAESATPEHRG